MDFYRRADDFGREISISQAQILNRKVVKVVESAPNIIIAMPYWDYFALFAPFFAPFAVESTANRGRTLMTQESSAGNLEPSLQHNPDRFAIGNMFLLQDARG